MLWDKGVREFVQAARLLHEAEISARFVLVGKSDTENPMAVPVSQLVEWQQQGDVEWWGHREDMHQVFAMSHIACLPTFYGEGLPKVLIEAAASGRALVATDVPGCREIVRHGENGLLVPARDVHALTEALKQLILDPALRQRMGERGREIAEAEFSVEKVAHETLAVYRSLLV
jgi:glycosyltransferase involved in cell wall biosynthesis